MANESSALIPENGTWSDYCDALQAERWARRLEAQRMSRSRQQTAPATSADNPDARGSNRDGGTRSS